MDRIPARTQCDSLWLGADQDPEPPPPSGRNSALSPPISDNIRDIAMMTDVSLKDGSSRGDGRVIGAVLTWLMEMGGLAAANTLACATVGAAWATTTAGMIPSVVLASRVADERQNPTSSGSTPPIIIRLNREYGQFWT